MSNAYPATLSTRQPFTAAVITRIQLIEAPYMNEYIFWYVDVLGFSHVYAVNTEPWNEEAIMKHIDEPMKKKMTLIPIPIDAEQQNKVGSYLIGLVQEYIKHEEYVLHVDSDELLLLPDTCTAAEETPLCRFLKSQRNIDKFVFHWLTIACDSMFCESMIDLWRTRDNLTGRINHSYKTMARIHNLKFVNHHIMTHKKHANTRICNVREIKNTPVMLHFITRSKSHTICKILYQCMKNTKSQKSSPENVRDVLLRDATPPLSAYPPRLLIHMHEVVYGIRNNILGDPESRAELVPACPYRYAEQDQKDVFYRLLRDIVGPDNLEKALDNLERYMDTSIIDIITTGKMNFYTTPGTLMECKVNKLKP